MSLSPVYDCVPVAHYGMGDRMALAIGGAYSYKSLTNDLLARELISWDTETFACDADARHFVSEFLERMIQALESTVLVEHMSADLLPVCAGTAQRLLAGK